MNLQRQQRTIVTVCNSRPHSGRKVNVYNHSHVNSIKCQLDTVHADYDHFVTITDCDASLFDEGIQVIPLPLHSRWQHWWCKLYQFNSELDIQGEVIFVDLDTLIGAQFDQLWSVYKTEHSMMIQQYFSLKRIVSDTQFLMHSGERFNSSVMRYTAHEWHSVYDQYVQLTEDPTYTPPGLGDEVFIQQHAEQHNMQLCRFPTHMTEFYSAYLRNTAWQNDVPKPHSEYTSSMDLQHSSIVVFGANYKPWLLTGDSKIRAHYDATLEPRT